MMLAADERADGRWTYGKGRNFDLSKDSRHFLGVIADHARDLLRAVRDDQLTLNAAYEQAVANRDAERDKREEQEQLAAEEADARRFIEDSAAASAMKAVTT